MFNEIWINGALRERYKHPDEYYDPKKRRLVNKMRKNRLRMMSSGLDLLVGRGNTCSEVVIAQI